MYNITKSKEGSPTNDSDVIMRINFNLKDIKGTRSQIWLKTTLNQERVNIYTKMLIEPEYWYKTSRTEIGEKAIIDNSFGRVQNKKNKEINENLQKIINHCYEYVSLVTQEDLLGHTKLSFNKESFVEFMKSRIEGKEASFERSPLTFIKDYIERKKTMINRDTLRTLSSGTIYNHQNTLKHLIYFCEDSHRQLTWEIFNERFEEDFTSWMVKKGYAANTIPQQFSIMKVWLKAAEKEDLIHDKSFHNYRSKGTDVENIYLTEEEIERIYNIDFSKDEVKCLFHPRRHIEISRDLFVFACCTGLRFGDYQDLSNAEIDKDTIKIYTKKTGKVVVLPILPLVRKILDKYDGKLPKAVHKANVLKHIKLCAKIAGIDTPTTITSIKGGKVISKTAPKYQFVVNHTARRSFATNAYLRGIPTLSIMAITGHTTESNFQKYIKISKEEHAKIVKAFF